MKPFERTCEPGPRVYSHPNPEAPEVVTPPRKSSYLMQFFEYAHLPEHLQVASRPFGELARTMDQTLPDNPEKSTALRKLLEAKDCAVRALIFE